MTAQRWYEAPDGRLPKSFAATTLAVSRETSPGERMPAGDLEGYLATGESALKSIRLAQLAARAPDFESILDLPSGHGRVTRWLRAAYPNALLTACDILTDGVDFCAEEFGAIPVYSRPGITAAEFPDRYDLIWVGSLFTHVDVPDWDQLIALFYELLIPGGVLVMTVHGELVAERMRAGNLYGYPDRSVARALRAYEHAGFAFLEEHPDQIEYGITLSRPEWVVSRVLRHADFRMAVYTEALWANHQDVVGVVKRKNDPDISNRPYT
jgi:SAM-dependent methyltransferase